MNDNNPNTDQHRTDDSALNDDVEAHGLSARGLVQDEDTEGHGITSGRALPDDENAEGHAITSGRVLPEDEDSEGHGFRGNLLPEDEDTQGHGVSSGR